ncbi:hypothetical protein [uncultured Tolumonas sp.]|uniref:hypothetical protein n=1 Tax=uncultured Tolumonas sp. TaxID=263765 RepID=UPI002A0A1927|nr:hypothetical protein [uncultured Tolumonas sp.]
MINWISVDDVLYQWNGQEIVCETGVGYSTHLDDHQLDGLEITDSSGNVTGQLFVDFSAGTIAYEPFDETHADGSILYSLDGLEITIALSQLPEVATLHDVIAIDDDMDLWSSIANVSQVHTDAVHSYINEHTTAFTYLDHQTVLDVSDNSLDLTLQNIDGTAPLIVERADSNSLYDLSEMNINTGGVDPLDSLYFYNAGQGS